MNPKPRLVVRLRNWVGDVTLGVPTLRRLAHAGYSLQLVGRGWARDLLAAEGWPVHPVAPGWRARAKQLRALRGAPAEEADARQLDAARPRALEGRSEGAGADAAREPGPERVVDTRIDALCLPYSFSSALDMRLAGLRAIGHATESRSWLLARTLPRPRGLHALAEYWQFADALLGRTRPLPERIGLGVSAPHREQARALRREHGLEPGYIVICPFAGGTWDHLDKTWPGFADFVAQVLPRLRRRVLILPGPGEEPLARQRYAGATCLAGVGLGTMAALLADAALMVSNDTGPGHIAAAVGTPVVSTLGPTDPDLWRPWGPRVTLLGGHGRWPTLEQAEAACVAALG